MSQNTNSNKNWRICNACKKEISFGAPYWICNVSTCTRKRTGFVFCSVSCWDSHVPMMNHRDSWAVELRAPNREDWQKVLSGLQPDMTFGKTAPPKVEEAIEKVRPTSAPSGKPTVIRRRPPQ